MKTLKTLSDLKNDRSDKNLFIRWSRGPAMDKKQGVSRDQVSGKYHNGLSAQNMRTDDPELMVKMVQEYCFLRRKDPKIYPWVFWAVRNGTDSDNAPTVDAETIEPVGRLSDEMIEKCQKYTFAYFSWQGKGFPESGKANVKKLLAEALA